MSDNFKEQLKDAICNNDFHFLEINKEKYSINDRFEDEGNDTLLIYSLSDPGSETYRYFMEREADISLLNDDGENVIHSIVYSSKVERLKEFLNDRNINSQTKDGTTPLLLAIALEHTEVANYLIENGANINLSDYENNFPIHLACWFGNYELVKKLIDKGADLNIKTNKGNLPLALAVNQGNRKIVRLIFNIVYS